MLNGNFIFRFSSISFLLKAEDLWLKPFKFFCKHILYKDDLSDSDVRVQIKPSSNCTSHGQRYEMLV